jgi:hypothetical protein
MEAHIGRRNHFEVRREIFPGSLLRLLFHVFSAVDTLWKRLGWVCSVAAHRSFEVSDD